MMDRHRGENHRFSGDQNSQFRTKPPPSRSPDGHRDYRGGFSRGGGRHNRPYDSPTRFSPTGHGGGFRPIGDGGGRGFDNDHVIPLSGNKRGFPFSSEQGRSPVHVDGSGSAKLFVGSVPRTATEEDIRPLFMEHGNVLEVALIKDKRTGLQQACRHFTVAMCSPTSLFYGTHSARKCCDDGIFGCCFVKYATSEEADRAIRGLHNQQTLPGGLGPIQVRYADGERERLGAVEYKLFVGSMNKHATEKEIEQVFAPYGRVDDVYLMRDEYKQSRGCGFVKFSSREMAMAAINGLSGVYTMQGCDKPLSVRFAEPKRPRPGETSNRGGPPAFGGPGFGPRFEQPGSRPPPNLNVSVSSNAWNPASSQNAEGQGFGNQMFPRPAMPPNMVVPTSSNNGPTNGLRPGFGISSSMPQQSIVSQSFTQSSQLANTTGQQQIPPLQRPVQSLTDLPSSGLGSLSNPPSSSQIPVNQVFPPQQYPSMQNFTSPYQIPANRNIQQQNQQVPPTQQTPSQLVQMLSQQKQSLQASLQSSQQAFTQIRQQYQQIQPSLQNMMPPQQTPQTNMQQSQWGGGVVQQTTVARTTQHNNSAAAVADAVPPTTSKSAPSDIPGTTAPTAKCSWTEHTSPDGFKYYYNSATQQSTWEKPEELTQFEQQQQKQSVQQPPQAQSYPQNMPTQQAQQVQFQQQYCPPQQFQQSSMPQQYQASGVRSQQNYQEFGYRQMPAGAGSVNPPAQFQQGGQQTNQEILWKKNNSSGI